MLVEATSRLEELVSAHQREIWRYLRFLGASPSEADDVTQETFLEVWRRPFADRGERAARAYLRRVARNHLLMRLRRARRRPLVLDLEAAEGAWERLAGDDAGGERLACLRACVDELDGRARRALELRYAERRSRAESAELLGLRPEGLKTLLRRTRARLRACVEARLERGGGQA